MIETINDFLSVAVMIFICLVCLYYTYKTFSKHHKLSVMLYENEYYNSDDNQEDSYL